MMTSPITSQLEVSVVSEHPLHADGVSVCEVSTKRSPIRATRELEVILKQFDKDTVVLIRRDSISNDLMQAISKEASDGKYRRPFDNFTKWSEIGGSSFFNAMPHIHESRNCHVAPNPTNCPTAFFSQDSIIKAVEAVRNNLNHHFSIRSQLNSVMQYLNVGNPTKVFFEHLHGVCPAIGISQVDLLNCIQEIQSLALVDNGVYRVDLGPEGYGIVGIPANCVHGRYVVDDITRGSNTAWRYFHE